jgi:hypothetical protein
MGILKGDSMLSNQQIEDLRIITQQGDTRRMLLGLPIKYEKEFDENTQARELYEKEKSRRIIHIERALKGDTGISREEQIDIARWFYESRWDGHAYDEEVTHEEILDNFCFKVFGTDIEGVLEAYDKYLG